MFEKAKLEKMIADIHMAILPTEDNINSLTLFSKSQFYIEPNVLTLKGEFIVVGDIHGQFYDLLNIFKITKFDENTKYLFLGDIVDRGVNSVECILLLLMYKLRYPENIYIIRGNHETEESTSIYGFKMECEQKLGLIFYLDFCSLFEYMPLCAIINEEIFCVHGGLVPDLHIKDLATKNRRVDNSLQEIFWSDPSDKNGFQNNPRGAGFLFGESEVDMFLNRNGLKKIVRSHQLVMEGYKEYYGGKLITIWSAPNYCYVSENIACVLIVSSMKEFRYLCFDKVEKQK